MFPDVLIGGDFAALPIGGLERYAWSVEPIPYCTVAEACRIAGVSDGYMRRLIREGKVEALKLGAAYLVIRSSVQKFERQPGMGRPRKPAPRAKRAGRKKPKK